MNMNIAIRKERRANRTRRRLRRPVDTGRLRLSVFRSARHIYAQVIDDTTGTAAAAASGKAMGLPVTRPTGDGWESAK